MWTYLEKYRGAVTYLAFSTLRARSTAPNDLPAELKAFLNENTPHMETHIHGKHGGGAFYMFQRFHDSLLEIIETERRQGIEVQQGTPMRFFMHMFRGQPLFWLMYNLNFPVEGRMTWDQVSMWAIQCLRFNQNEIPAWPMELRNLRVWKQDTLELWNKAVIEVYADTSRRFCAMTNLHERF